MIALDYCDFNVKKAVIVLSWIFKDILYDRGPKHVSSFGSLPVMQMSMRGES